MLYICMQDAHVARHTRCTVLHMGQLWVVLARCSSAACALLGAAHVTLAA